MSNSEVNKRLEVIEKNQLLMHQKIDLLLNQKATGLGTPLEEVNISSSPNLVELDKELREELFHQ